MQNHGTKQETVDQHKIHKNTIYLFKTRSRYKKKGTLGAVGGVSKTKTTSFIILFPSHYIISSSNMLIWRSTDTLATGNIFFFGTNGRQQVSDILLAVCAGGTAKASSRASASDSSAGWSVD